MLSAQNGAVQRTVPASAPYFCMNFNITLNPKAALLFVISVIRFICAREKIAANVVYDKAFQVTESEFAVTRINVESANLGRIAHVGYRHVRCLLEDAVKHRILQRSF